MSRPVTRRLGGAIALALAAAGVSGIRWNLGLKSTYELLSPAV